MLVDRLRSNIRLFMDHYFWGSLSMPARRLFLGSNYPGRSLLQHSSIHPCDGNPQYRTGCPSPGFTRAGRVVFATSAVQEARCPRALSPRWLVSFRALSEVFFDHPTDKGGTQRLHH